MRSLAIKLTLAFLVVSVLGAVLVALLVNWQTRRQFDNFMYDLYHDDLVDLSGQLSTYYQEHGNWEGLDLEAVVIRDRPSGPGREGHDHWLPVMLVDAGRQVVYGGSQHQPGELLSARVVNQGMPIEADGETVGWVVLDSFGGGRGGFPDSPEANFLDNLNRATALSASGAAIIALLLGILLARTISHPVSELKAATQRVAQGQLGYQVPVRSQDEIGQLATSFNQMSTDLAHSNELRRQMTADIAHDLRTPLSVMQGYAEALDEGKLQGSPDIYGAMHKQVKHLTRLVEDLRTLSLADAGQLPLWRQAVDPRDLLEHSVLVYMPQAEQRGVALHLDIPDGLPKVEVDPDRIGQVLGNLISNALHHTPLGEEIQLSAESTNHSLVLQVHDTGTGISPEDLPHVFDRFYQGDKSRSADGESGLGLAIARSIVEAHNGRIRAESSPGQGTTFIITLPAL